MAPATRGAATLAALLLALLLAAAGTAATSDAGACSCPHCGAAYTEDERDAIRLHGDLDSSGDGVPSQKELCQPVPPAAAPPPSGPPLMDAAANDDSLDAPLPEFCEALSAVVNAQVTCSG